jgi:hypothetical protein
MANILGIDILGMDYHNKVEKKYYISIPKIFAILVISTRSVA